MDNSQIIILKLGGSVVTDKMNVRPKIRESAVKQIAVELKKFIKRYPKTKIILLHGAGSFGHPLVYRHKLLEHPLKGPRILGFAKTICSMRQMANSLTDIFRTAKLPVLPIQASAVLSEKNNKICLSNVPSLKQMLDAGFIPLLGGDMAITKKKRAVVVSADTLAVLLAKAFTNSRIVFASDVDGVLDNGRPFDFLSRKNLEILLKKMSYKKSQRDVTGGMAGKLKNILNLKGKNVIIFNGLKSGGLTKALLGKPIGTRLEL